MVGRKSGQFATMLLASSCEFASLLVHRFQAMYSLYWVQFELLADQAVIDGGLSPACRNDQLKPRCSQCAIQCGEAWVGVGSLKLSNGCLADCQPLCKIGLG
jgi:hypothetical protein